MAVSMVVSAAMENAARRYAIFVSQDKNEIQQNISARMGDTTAR